MAKSVMRSAEPEGAAETWTGGGQGVAGATMVRIVQTVQVVQVVQPRMGQQKGWGGEGASERVSEWCR